MIGPPYWVASRKSRLVETLFYRQLKKSTALREDVAHYERAEKGGPRHSYDHLTIH